MSTWAHIAELVKTKHMQGGLVAQSVPGLPFLLQEGIEVFFTPPLLTGPKSAVVEQVEAGPNADTALVYFAGIEDLETAELLVGKHCIVRTADIPEELLAAQIDFLDYAVVDTQHGALGVLTDVITNPAQSILVVSRAGKADILIPLVDEFVVDIEDELERIVVSIPQSLIDLAGE